MVFFLSTRLYLVLVLFNHCFTVPIVDEQHISSSTADVSNNDEVTDGELLTNDTTSMSTELQKKQTIDEYSTSEPFISSTKKSINKKRHHRPKHLSFTTIQSMTSSTDRSLFDRHEDEQVTFESMMLSTESFDSNISFTTIQPTTQVTYKHEESTHSMTTKQKISITNQSTEEYSKDSTIPTVIIDKKAFDTVTKIPNDLFILDGNTDIVVTSLPERISSSLLTTMIYKEKEALNQGSTLVLFLLAALLFCACVMASTLAFVSSFAK